MEPAPVMLHVYVSTSPGQAQLALSGICRVSGSIEIREQILLIQNFSNCVNNYSVTGLTMHAHSHNHKNYSYTNIADLLVLVAFMIL